MNTQHGHLSAEAAQAFLDGRASEEDVRTVEAHVHSCQECGAALDRWKAVYARLGHLNELEPSVGFASAVMERFQQEAHVAATVALDAQGHLTTELLLDYLDGQLGGAEAEAAQIHLAACSDCSGQETEWTALLTSIGSVQRYAPSAGFSEAVLVAARIKTPHASALSLRVRALGGASGWVRSAVARIRSRDQRGLAALAGLATAPAAVLATLGWVVLTHPLVTTSGLLRFALLKAGQVADGMMTTVLGGTSDSALLYALYSGFEIMASAPGTAALGGLAVLMLMSLSTWVLFRNLAPMRESLNPAPGGQGFVRANG
jgi:anti-sigma factor RsiW